MSIVEKKWKVNGTYFSALFVAAKSLFSGKLVGSVVAIPLSSPALLELESIENSSHSTIQLSMFLWKIIRIKNST